MAKRFKFRISRLIPSFHSCRSKDPSTLPSNPVPSFLRLTPPKPKLINSHFSTITPSPSPPPPFKAHHSSLRRHVSSAFVSVGCGFRSRATLSDDDQNETHHFHWEQEDKWHVVAKVYDADNIPRRKIYNSSVSGGSDDDDVLPLPPPLPRLPCDRKKKRRAKKKRTTPKFRISTSSADSYGLFSSDGCDDERDIEEEETETLVSSSRSFSTDSSFEFNPQLETIRETATHMQGVKKKKPKQKKAKTKKKTKARRSVSSPESDSPARLSVFQRLIPCSVEGKVRESFAVVKKSEDPYEDFRRSMMDMILEKQMFEESDLEQLLHCFLSLNSSKHHAVIVDAFTEIWEALFATTPTKLKQ